MVANIEDWAREQPAVLEVSQQLNEAGVVWGYFSGALAEAMGVRPAHDLDVLVRRQISPKLLGRSVHNRNQQS